MWQSKAKTLIILIQTFELFAQNLREFKEELIGNPHLETISQPRETVIVIPLSKCCGINEVLNSSGCISSDIKFTPDVTVYANNETDINDEPISAQSIIFRPIVQQIVCNGEKYPLIQDQDHYVLLQNGTLLVQSMEKSLPPESYCFETINLGNQTNSDWLTTPIICFEDEVSQSSTVIYVLYGIGILVSALLLIVTAVIFSSVEEIRDTRGKCVVCYSIAMAAVFILLANAQFSGIGNETCTVFGFIIQFFLVQSFTWLTILGWETFYKIKNYDNVRYEKDGTRFKIYFCIGILVPILLIFLTSYKSDRVPGIPNTFLKSKFGRIECWFDQSTQAVLYFYFPIAVADLINIILCILMRSYLVSFEENSINYVVWRITKLDLISMFRSFVFALIVSNFCWIMKLTTFFVKELGNFGITMDIFDSLQGAFIFSIFVLHRPVQHLVKLKLMKNQNIDASYENGAVDLHTSVNNQLNEEKKLYPKPKQLENLKTDAFCESDVICAGHTAFSIKIRFNHSIE